MRYVIAVCLITIFLIWDASANDGRYLDYAVRELKRITGLVGV